MLRYLAFDVGERRIGIAVSDPLGITAQGIETYTRCGDEAADVAHLVKLANGYRPVRLVFGLPRNMDGSCGFQAEAVKAFAEKVVASWDGEYDYCDERMTTMSANRVLLEGDVRRNKRKGVVDKLAAVFILESYLLSHPVQ